ncbi:toxin-antitoxin system YwqK family antitoxin [Variovorax sp. GT1P44]|uniref:toxin-antitoxin system YwqK family antitoxin n=1 Tax=Variovorax sp. GT1P44 TaxID=3443742 RepID=UPI003F4529CA
MRFPEVMGVVKLNWLKRLNRPNWRAAGLAALFPLLCHTAAHAVQDCEINGVAVNPANGNTTAGKTGLMRCKDRDSRELAREQQIQSGTFVGVVRIYDQGKLVKEYSVNARGNMEGRAREYSPAGQVLRDATYDDGHETGLVRSFYPSGQLRRVTYFADVAGERASVEFTERGQLSALRCGDKPVLAPAVDDARLCGFGNAPSQVELFDNKGILRSRLSYLAGKRVRSEELYDNGKPAALDELAGNQRTERRFSSEGIKRREVVSLVSERGATKQREQEFSEKGTLVRDQRWNAAGEPVSDESFYLNGQPLSKAVYGVGGDPRQIEVTEYHDNGQRAAVGRYLSTDRRQTAIGTHQRFSDNGTLIAESIYDDKGRITRERSWDASGKLERDDEVFEDGSRKAYAK